MQYTLVLGYGWSGSSAVADLLREIEGHYQLKSEFRLIVDPHGLSDLRHNIVEQWESVNCDYALREFKSLLKVAYRPSTKFQVGYNYRSEFGEQFWEVSDKYISQLIKYKYSGTWIGLDFSSSRLGLICKKIMRRIPIVGNKYQDRMSFSSVDAESFDKYTKAYINSLFSLIPEVNSESNIVIDQGVFTQNANMAEHYFEKAKIVIVDRDPRDIFFDLIKCKGLIGSELELTKDPYMYIDWHKAYRRKQKEIMANSNVLFIHFEDLVLNYEHTLNDIYNFLNIEPRAHVNKMKYFNPMLSRKNVGMWREKKNSVEMEILYKELRDECYQGV